MAIVEFEDVSRVYVSGDHELKALDDVNLKLEKGKFVVILGPSGAGKSTLLNLLGGAGQPNERQDLCAGEGHFHPHTRSACRLSRSDSRIRVPVL